MDEKNQKLNNFLAWARQVVAVPRSEQTLATYRAELRRLGKARDPLGQSENRNTRGIQRAALRLVIATRAIAALASGNQSLLEDLAKKKMDIDRAAENWSRQVSGGGPNNKIRRGTKKVSLRRLPADWRIKFLEAAARANYGLPCKYFAAITVLAGSGCRPSELEKGVQVSLDGKCENLIFEITGTKVTEKNGYRIRKVTVSLDSPLSSWVCLGFIQAPAKALNDCVVRIGKKVFPNRSSLMQISPYTFRHAIAGDFKFSAGAETEMAAALGHRSTRTKQLYGPRRGPGGQKLVAVDCTEEVREYEKSELPKLKKRSDKNN